uniref:Uncharacterized protein n=1 Tax=Romanomermis culicivorax TaxID=13658 RepID=A0A915JH92_ROMCU
MKQQKNQKKNKESHNNIINVQVIIASPLVPASSTTPLSSLMPGMMPFDSRTLTNGVPSSKK